MKQRCLYQGYYLTTSSTRSDCGRYQARVAITALGGEKTRSQRFLDLDHYATEAEADEHAIAAGKAWIDAHGGSDAGSRALTMPAAARRAG